MSPTDRPTPGWVTLLTPRTRLERPTSRGQEKASRERISALSSPLWPLTSFWLGRSRHNPSCGGKREPCGGLAPQNPSKPPRGARLCDTRVTTLNRQLKNSRKSLGKGPANHGPWPDLARHLLLEIKLRWDTLSRPFLYLLFTAVLITAQNSDCPETEKRRPSPPEPRCPTQKPPDACVCLRSK